MYVETAKPMQVAFPVVIIHTGEPRDLTEKRNAFCSVHRARPVGVSSTPNHPRVLTEKQTVLKPCMNKPKKFPPIA